MKFINLTKYEKDLKLFIKKLLHTLFYVPNDTCIHSDEHFLQPVHYIHQDHTMLKKGNKMTYKYVNFPASS